MAEGTKILKTNSLHYSLTEAEFFHVSHLSSLQVLLQSTPRPRRALLVCLKKYSAIGNSAIGYYVVLCSNLY